MGDWGTGKRFVRAAARLCALGLVLSSCLSPRPAATYSSGPAMVILPPESWPPECPIVFVDAKGLPIRGAVRSDSVRFAAFGLSGRAEDLRLNEDGSLGASSLSFDAVKGRKGGKLVLPRSRLAPLPADPSGASIEFRTQDGWTVSLQGCDPDSGASFLGELRSLSEERLPGQTASSSARFTGLPLHGKAVADWAAADIGELTVLLDMATGADLLMAPDASVLPGSGDLVLSCQLSLSGGAAVEGQADPGALVFPSCAISGGGRVSLPEGASGLAGFRLSGGYSLSLTGASFMDGSFMASGRLFFPADLKADATIEYPEGGIDIRGIRALDLSTSAVETVFRFSASGARIEASGFTLSHAGKAKASFREASILSFHAPESEEGAIRIPLGPFSMENILPMPGQQVFQEPIRLPGYAEGLELEWIGWGPGGFRLGCRAALPGFLGAAGPELPDLSPGQGGELFQAEALAAKPIAFLGRQCVFTGLRLLPGGSASLDSLEPYGEPGGELRGGLRARKIMVGADGGLFPGFEAEWVDLAGGSDFSVSGLSALPEGGIRLSGSALLSFSSEGHRFSGRLETDDLRVSSSGELGIGEYRWLKEKVPAFLGLVFRKAEFAFKKGRALLLLSEGAFASGGVWPSGGELHGLGLDLDNMKYDLTGLSFPEPATLARPEGVFTLTSFLSAVDDVYLFSGRVRLISRPGAPWAAGEELSVPLLRVDSYGNIRELRLSRDGSEFDGKPWVK